MPVKPIDNTLKDRAVTVYAALGSFQKAAQECGLTVDQVRYIVRSPDGANRVERILREDARQRAVRLSSMFDRMIDAIEDCMVKGNEVIDKNGGRHDVRVQMRDLVSGIAWISNSLEKWNAMISAHDVIDITQLSVEQERQNLERLEELAAEGRKRLASREPPPPPKPASTEDWFGPPES